MSKAVFCVLASAFFVLLAAIGCASQATLDFAVPGYTITNGALEEHTSELQSL
jgi:hypothetical protein